MSTWQDDIKNIFNQEKEKEIKKKEINDSIQAQFTQFAVQKAQPAFKKLGDEFKKYGRTVDIFSNDQNYVGVRIKKSGSTELSYSFNIKGNEESFKPIATIEFANKEDGKQYSVEIHLSEDATEEEIIKNVINQYKYYVTGTI